MEDLLRDGFPKSGPGSQRGSGTGVSLRPRPWALWVVVSAQKGAPMSLIRRRGAPGVISHPQGCFSATRLTLANSAS